MDDTVRGTGHRRKDGTCVWETYWDRGRQRGQGQYLDLRQVWCPRQPGSGGQIRESSLKWWPGVGTTLTKIQAGETSGNSYLPGTGSGLPGAGPLWPQGGAVCVLALCDLLSACLNLLVSLYGLASHFTPTRGGAKPTHCPLTACPLRPAAPMTVVKQRMQMYNSPHRSALSCIRTVWRTEGLRAFYRSYTTQLTMNIPFQSIHFITYEFLQEQVNPHRGYNPQSHIISGGLAGALAAAATTPLDVCKTLLNTQENMALNLANISGRLSGMANAFRTVYQLNGLPGYFKGMQARILYQMPSTAISWSVYEFFKYFLTKHKLENRTPY